MHLHITVETHQGVIHDVQAFRNPESATRAEEQWLEELGIEDEAERETKAMNGTEFRTFVCELEP